MPTKQRMASLRYSGAAAAGCASTNKSRCNDVSKVLTGAAEGQVVAQGGADALLISHPHPAVPLAHIHLEGEETSSVSNRCALLQVRCSVALPPAGPAAPLPAGPVDALQPANGTGRPAAGRCVPPRADSRSAWCRPWWSAARRPQSRSCTGRCHSQCGPAAQGFGWEGASWHISNLVGVLWARRSCMAGWRGWHALYTHTCR